MYISSNMRIFYNDFIKDLLNRAEANTCKPVYANVNVTGYTLA